MQFTWIQLEEKLKKVNRSIYAIPKNSSTGWTQEATDSIEEMIKALLSLTPLEVEIAITEKLYQEIS